MLLAIILWVSSITFVSFATGWYIKIYNRADLALGFYVIYLAMAQILATKIVTFNFLFFQISAPAAVLIFPFTFQIIDIVNEAFNRKAVERMIIIAFITQVFMNIFLIIGLSLPPAPFWNLESPWRQVLGLVPRITIASWVAFILSQNLDAFLFDLFRKMTGGKGLWLRNVASDVLSLAVDSVLFITLAFYGLEPVVPLIIGQIIIKGGLGAIDFPLIYLSRWAMGRR